MEQKFDLPKGFVVILAALTATVPLAIDAYLPSFSQIAQYFYTSIDDIEVTISIYLLGFSIGQLFGGPLSDRYGRKKFIYIGLGIFIIFSFAISIANNIEQFWLFRFLQAVGGGLAVVNTNSIVRDIYHGNEGARVFSIIAMIMMAAPMLAPAIGTVILYNLGWQYIFTFLALYALCLLFFMRLLPETSPKTKDSQFFANYKLILASAKTRLFIFAGGFGMAGLFIYVTKASFVYMGYFHVDATIFTILFGLNAVAIILFSQLNLFLLRHYSPLNVLFKGVFIQLLAALILLAFSSVHVIGSVVLLIMIYIGAVGLIFGNATSLVLEDFPEISATANAIYGVIGFILSSIMGFLASYFHTGSLEPVFILMVCTSLTSLMFLLYVLNKHVNPATT